MFILNSTASVYSTIFKPNLIELENLLFFLLPPLFPGNQIDPNQSKMQRTARIKTDIEHLPIRQTL